MDKLTTFFMYGIAMLSAFVALIAKPKGFLLVVKVICMLLFSASMYLLLN